MQLDLVRLSELFIKERTYTEICRVFIESNQNNTGMNI